MTIKISGLAYRQGGGGERLDPSVVVPETVPLSIEFDRTVPPLGQARLTRLGNGDIWADAELSQDLSGLFLDPLGQPIFPKLAISLSGITVAGVGDGRLVRHGSVDGLALCTENADTEIPPYQVLK